jgi:CBS domain-containing protein
VILQVRHAMTGHPFTIPYDATVTETARTMITAGIDTIVVTKKDEIFGAVTSNDILRYTYTADFNPAKTPVGNITNEDIILARPRTSLDDVRNILTESNINTLPVVDKELVGYITLRDLIRIKPEKMEKQLIS